MTMRRTNLAYRSYVNDYVRKIISTRWYMSVRLARREAKDIWKNIRSNYKTFVHNYMKTHKNGEHIIEGWLDANKHYYNLNDKNMYKTVFFLVTIE